MKIRAMLTALCCVVGLVFVTGCESPEKGFKEWKKAVLKGDVAKVKARTVKKHADEAEAIVEWVKNDSKAKKELEESKIVKCEKNGDKATLKVKFGDKEEDVKMVKEDGKWKVED